MGRLGLRADVKRLPIFGLGCAGGVLGLARAADLARAAPDSRVLLLVVELCALSFRKNDVSKSNVVATALFGDGAAAAVVSCRGDGPALGAAGEHTWPDTLDIMGWDVTEDGLKAVFSRAIPSLVRRHMRDVAGTFLARHALAFSDIDHFICHPGGAKVLDALEEAFRLPSGALAAGRSVLRDYGNMSAATVLFVLERALGAGGLPGRSLVTTLGPGFTAGFLLLEAA
jgi:alkylresorcinol/alkylpyrone synthase